MGRLDPGETKNLWKALKEYYKTDVMSAKGGFFVRGKGFISLAKARKVTGIKATPRARRGKTGGFGDYAILRKIVGKV